ncbi:adenylyl-sulfate kinase [Deinococcus hopiensis]|uniref:Adenylyl-sulfate kinase n=1 Tax=Deinococcus hopiensis KR-140 TaxID=695939 RepID=A0A1W1VC84_9DEIO|nr:adenylyl-sulfate kinase [Deinococcus hopiensis]SMB90906.1 adenylylsulfate kinase [Deinococcus hopiensis KR-140]
MTATLNRPEVGTGRVVWFTGLSGAGKSTLASALYTELTARGERAELLDGDAVRENLSKGLGFTKADRDTNVRRIAFVAGLLAKHGVTVLVSAISPYAETRREVLAALPNATEVFVDAPLEVVTERDVKGLYLRALAGEIAHFTGVSDPYEAPESPDLHLRTDLISVEQGVARLLAHLEGGNV